MERKINNMSTFTHRQAARLWEVGFLLVPLGSSDHVHKASEADCVGCSGICQSDSANILESLLNMSVS